MNADVTSPRAPSWGALERMSAAARRCATAPRPHGADARVPAAALAALALLGLPVAGAAQGGPTAFVGGTVIDGTGAPPLPDAAVVVEGDRIAAVGPASEVEMPEDATVVDATGRWIIPGLIDAHVHFFQSGGLYTRPDVIDLRAVRPYAEEIARIRADLPEIFARYVASGVTGVVDVGGPMWNVEARETAGRTAVAPRVAVAGPLLATWVPPELADVADPPLIEIETPEEARAEVRRQLEHEPDLIKIWFVRPGSDLGADVAWVRAAVEEAHAAGVPVVAHATGLRVARAVVDAGVDVLAHSVEDRPIGEGLLAAMRAGEVVYTTTLVVEEGYDEVLGRRVDLTPIERRLGDPEAIASWDDLDSLPPDLLPGWIASLAPRPLNPVKAENLIRVQRAGITVAAGSDAGNIGTLHGPALHRELELMVEAGLTPTQVLVAATRGGAAVMGRSDDLGTLEPGKLADMVLLEADPLADIRNTRRIDRVVKGGAVFEPGAIVREFLSEG